MRRAALRGCTLLLQCSRSVASEPAALLAAGLQAAAAGGPDVRRPLWAPSWPQAASFYAAAPCERRAASSGSDGSSDSAGGSDGRAGASDDDIEWVARNHTGSHRGKLLAVRPELAAELRPLIALTGAADAAELSRRVAALGPKPERRVVEHGTAVVQLLLRLGVLRTQLATLLHRCPVLFSWPAEQRAALLFGQLARLGLTAAQAARCFEQQPTAAGRVSFKPAIPVLAELLAAGSRAGSSRSGEQLLGDFLRKQPASIRLLYLQPDTLQQRISNLMQRYGPHWEQQNKQAVIVAAMQDYCMLLTRPPAHLLALDEVLQQELGQQPGDGTRLLAAIVQRHGRAAGCSPETLQRRAQALKAEFGLERLLQAGPESVAELLHVDTATWQRALAVWRLLGVPDPVALGLRNARLLTLNWLAADRLASLVALQQLLPWQPSAVDAVQCCSSYIASSAPPRLIGRLLFLQQEGALSLLVADKRAARQQWRRRHGLPANRRAEVEPQLISLRDTAVESGAKFCCVLEESQAARADAPSSGSSRYGSRGSIAERYHAFMTQLPQLPAYQRLLDQGVAESRRLAALLPPELAAVAGRKEAADEREAE